MSNVFVVIGETMPVNGTYPANHNDSFWGTEQLAWQRLVELSDQYGTEDGVPVSGNDTVFYAEADPEKFEYIEYRIEEHTIQTGDNS